MVHRLFVVCVDGIQLIDENVSLAWQPYVST